jgi:hypothetical protein
MTVRLIAFAFHIVAGAGALLCGAMAVDEQGRNRAVVAGGQSQSGESAQATGGGPFAARGIGLPSDDLGGVPDRTRHCVDHIQNDQQQAPGSMSSTAREGRPAPAKTDDGAQRPIGHATGKAPAMAIAARHCTARHIGRPHAVPARDNLKRILVGNLRKRNQRSATTGSPITRRNLKMLFQSRNAVFRLEAIAASLRTLNDLRP